MFQNLLKLMVPLSKYNVLKIKVIFWYFKQEYVTYNTDLSYLHVTLCTMHIGTAGVPMYRPTV